MYTVNDIFTSALQPFSGVSRNSFRSPNDVIYDAVRTVSNTVQIVEAKRVVPLLPALYSGDNLYAVPADFDTPIGFYPYDNRQIESINRTNPASISRDTYNVGRDFAIEYRNGAKLLRIQPGSLSISPTMVNQCDSLTADGTVAVSGDAASLALNTVFFLNGTASIDFNIVPSGGSATVTFTDMISKDLSAITRDGVFSVGVFVPVELENKITSLTLVVGTDASNYYTMTASTTAYGGAFTQGFNIVRFERRSASETGTIDDTDITYLALTITHTATTTVTGVKIDAFSAHKGIGFSMEYYGNYFFIQKNSTTYLQKPTDNALLDTVIFGKEVFELVVREAQKIMDQQLRGEKAGTVYQQAERDLQGIWGDFSNPGLYEQYRLKFPSERRSVITQYADSYYE